MPRTIYEDERVAVILKDVGEDPSGTVSAKAPKPVVRASDVQNAELIAHTVWNAPRAIGITALLDAAGLSVRPGGRAVARAEDAGWIRRGGNKQYVRGDTQPPGYQPPDFGF